MFGGAEFLAACAAVVLAGMPALTFVHELGHALAAAVVVGGRATLVQGPAPARLRLSVWRLDLRLHGPVPPHRVMVGWALWGPHPQAWRHAVATAAGPAASALSAGACLLGVAETGGFVHLSLLLLLPAATLQTLSSALPVRYGRWFGSYAGEASDGLRIRRLLQGAPEPAPLV